ncbi:DUF456 domain-containing protein [Granulicoccus phenolivorans]|uniref:DUF456 domain-containing protein n=1 Tax=Granulicoccus phenolivorans TaxID=266854 RepID=UPI001B7FD945|nr:DUF456 domain-containing protein [Granulicoccus phenolivorans]
MIASIVAGLLVIIGIIGIVVPVLPGSFLVLIGLLVWALFIGGLTGWLVFGIGAVFVICGMIATYVLTGRVMKREKIPDVSVIIGIVCGIAGMFVLPALGLPIGFAVGLFVSELVRVREPKLALKSSWEAIKATGAGMLVELGCALVAAATLSVGMFVHFTR